MRERAISVRGSLEVAAKIGEGTTITLMLPCRKVADPVQNLPAGRSA
jgi:nitrate/nitrite-specific signal transduction histidine kinase